MGNFVLSSSYGSSYGSNYGSYGSGASAGAISATIEEFLDASIGTMIAFLIFALLIRAVVAALVSSVVLRKGYAVSETHAFAMCFFLGAVAGLLYIMILPDRNIAKKNKELTATLKKIEESNAALLKQCKQEGEGN